MSVKKTVARADAYEVWRAGDWTWYVRKFYKSREATLADSYGRVLCDVTSPMTLDRGDTGDVYYSEITRSAQLVSTNYPEA